MNKNGKGWLKTNTITVLNERKVKTREENTDKERKFYQKLGKLADGSKCENERENGIEDWRM